MAAIFNTLTVCENKAPVIGTDAASQQLLRSEQGCSNPYGLGPWATIVHYNQAYGVPIDINRKLAGDGHLRNLGLNARRSIDYATEVLPLIPHDGWNKGDRDRILTSPRNLGFLPWTSTLERKDTRLSRFKYETLIHDCDVFKSRYWLQSRGFYRWDKWFTLGRVNSSRLVGGRLGYVVSFMKADGNPEMLPRCYACDSKCQTADGAQYSPCTFAHNRAFLASVISVHSLMDRVKRIA